MRRILVLSPHRDDAVFSLGGWMKRWTDMELPVSVLNFYTRSQYAPWIASGGDVSSRRAYEDRAAIRLISPAIRVHSRGLSDAPLRLGREVRDVMQRSPNEVRPEDVRQAIADMPRARVEYVIAPLGLGGHIDHLTVREAALRTINAQRLAFYEDRPYASWTEEWERERALGPLNRDALRRLPGPVACGRLVKQSWVARYRSQVRREQARIVVGNGREVIWAPKVMAAAIL